MTIGPRVLVLAILLLPVSDAGAQAPPWPAQSPPWPGEPGATQSAPPASVPVKPRPNAAQQAVSPVYAGEPAVAQQDEAATLDKSTPVSSASPALAVRVGPAQKQQPDVSRRIDTSAIAAKMKNGVELMRYGEVTKARMMFERAAEAGDGAGAFALAETYDPLVLGELRPREGITPDLTLPRSWYKRASDLGAPNAQDRILRLSPDDLPAPGEGG
jgi:TPR repeat protein